ncbi:hypothetical protein C1645_827507, partial [Glomus cerebriforme]
RIKKDEIKAFELYKTSAEQQCSSAQNRLGFLYENGIGTKKDVEKAIYWYRKAVDNGYQDAVNSLDKLLNPKSKVFNQSYTYYGTKNLDLIVYIDCYGYYKSETGQTVVYYSKHLVSLYLGFCSAEKKMRRGEAWFLLIWIFQDYPEVAAYFLRTLNPVILNVAYDKLSEMQLIYDISQQLNKRYDQKAMIFSYNNKYVIPIILSSKLPTILRRRGLTPEEMLEPAEFAILEKEVAPANIAKSAPGKA